LGQKTFDEHWHSIGDEFNLSQSEVAQMRADFFAGDALNESLVSYVQRLREADYKTGILSNFADDARYVWSRVYPFIQYFDGIVISYEVGLMKPDPRIYHLALESLDVEPNEALFIDDFSENIQGAKAVGLQALHFTDPEVAQQRLIEITGVK
jgi:epoxide hydrolase-like predicted phosphatase